MVRVDPGPRLLSEPFRAFHKAFQRLKLQYSEPLSNLAFNGYNCVRPAIEVFLMTSFFSVAAYAWVLVVYTIWTPNRVSIPEARPVHHPTTFCSP